MPNLISDEAIILKRTDYGEADKIITVLTKSNGKIGLIAKGVRKITSRRKGHLEPFTHVKLAYTEPHNLGVLTEVETITTLDRTEENWERLGQLYHICELVDRLLPEQEPHDYVFRLLVRALSVIHEEENHIRREEILALFEEALLKDLGYLADTQLLQDRSVISERRGWYLQVIESVLERNLKTSVVFAHNQRKRYLR